MLHHYFSIGMYFSLSLNFYLTTAPALLWVLTVFTIRAKILIIIFTLNYNSKEQVGYFLKTNATEKGFWCFHLSLCRSAKQNRNVINYLTKMYFDMVSGNTKLDQ